MTPKQRKNSPAQTQRQHRGLAVLFGSLTLLFALVTVYFAFARTTITLTAEQQPVTVVFPVTIQRDDPAEDTTDVIKGTFAETTAQATAQLDTLAGSETVDAKATGAVTITNNWNQAQPLAATTRLLSSGGVLFRIDDFVSVPAGGTVTVAVTADQPGAAGNIEPSHFTIPGLWSGLQDTIFGDSDTAMTGGIVTRSVITEEERASLQQKLEAALTDQAQQSLTQTLTANDAPTIADTIKLFADDPSIAYSSAVGEVADTYSASASAKVIGIAFSQTDLYTTIINKLLEQLPDGETLTGFGEENYALALNTYDTETGIAELTVTAQGTSTIDLTSEVFSPAKLTNKSNTEITALLEHQSIVSAVTVHFSPFWVTRSPALASHIKMTVSD